MSFAEDDELNAARALAPMPSPPPRPAFGWESTRDGVLVVDSLEDLKRAIGADRRFDVEIESVTKQMRDAACRAVGYPHTVAPFDVLASGIAVRLEARDTRCSCAALERFLSSLYCCYENVHIVKPKVLSDAREMRVEFGDRGVMFVTFTPGGGSGPGVCVFAEANFPDQQTRVFMHEQLRQRVLPILEQARRSRMFEDAR